MKRFVFIILIIMVASVFGDFTKFCELNDGGGLLSAFETSDGYVVFFRHRLPDRPSFTGCFKMNYDGEIQDTVELNLKDYGHIEEIVQADSFFYFITGFRRSEIFTVYKYDENIRYIKKAHFDNELGVNPGYAEVNDDGNILIIDGTTIRGKKNSLFLIDQDLKLLKSNTIDLPVSGMFGANNVIWGDKIIIDLAGHSHSSTGILSLIVELNDDFTLSKFQKNVIYSGPRERYALDYGIVLDGTLHHIVSYRDQGNLFTNILRLNDDLSAQKLRTLQNQPLPRIDCHYDDGEELIVAGNNWETFSRFSRKKSIDIAELNRDLGIIRKNEINIETGDSIKSLGSYLHTRLFKTSKGGYFYATEYRRTNSWADNDLLLIYVDSLDIYNPDIDAAIEPAVYPISLYPNPFKDGLIIDLVGQSHIEIFDTRGKLVYETTDNMTFRWEPKDNLPKGLYLIKIHELDTGQTGLAKAIYFK